MEETCVNPECAVHQRNDVDEFRRIPGTDINTFLGLTYVNEYAVFTEGSWDAAQILAIQLLSAIGATYGESEARKDIAITEDKIGMTAASNFQTEYRTVVVNVGHGSLSDLGDAKPKPEYENITYTAEDARDLHNELVATISAGTFNGKDL